MIDQQIGKLVEQRGYGHHRRVVLRIVSEIFDDGECLGCISGDYGIYQLEVVIVLRYADVALDGFRG